MPSTTEDVRYQVFVSSTFTDLKEEREKVLQAILECKAFPAGMELFPSADDEQFEFIKREIDSSDYYLVIIGGRYGSTADDSVSFTEKEFDYAQSQKKPILPFLIEDTTKLPFERCEPEKSARLKLRSFSDKAKKSRLVKFFANPDELKSQVLQSLSYQFRVNPKRGWIPAGQSNRDDLEAIRQLQGRVIELESENVELRRARESAADQLAQGDEPISWEIEVGKISLDYQEGGKRVSTKFPTEKMVLKTNWDELLCFLYASGTSRLEALYVEGLLFRMFLYKAPNHETIDKMWWTAVDHLYKFHDRLTLFCFHRVKTEIFRQFAGLGLIEEASETREVVRQPTNHISFVDPFSRQEGDSSSKRIEIVPIWVLTKRGAERLALLRGYRRGSFA